MRFTRAAQVGRLYRYTSTTRDGRAMNARCVINKQTSRCGRRVASRRIGHRESRNVKGERGEGEGEEENGFVPEPLEEDE